MVHSPSDLKGPLHRPYWPSRPASERRGRRTTRRTDGEKSAFGERLIGGGAPSVSEGACGHAGGRARAWRDDAGAAGRAVL